MLVKKEHNNKKDPHAMVVEMPLLSEIPATHKYAVTREADKKRGVQRVADIAGKIVGRIPANIGKFLQLNNRHIDNIAW